MTTHIMKNIPRACLLTSALRPKPNNGEEVLLDMLPPHEICQSPKRRRKNHTIFSVLNQRRQNMDPHQVSPLRKISATPKGQKQAYRFSPHFPDGPTSPEQKKPQRRQVFFQKRPPSNHRVSRTS
eukprot:Lithocolla_globosa_v1_NODE_5830_length_1179_cov_2.459075.p1 type:complete len:125 gc:universal NODE_5830_length_1179_cov_2.459075:249-623(+)